jgi:hypothetical protein
MNTFLRRPSVWVVYLLLFAFYAVMMFLPGQDSSVAIFPKDQIWQFAAQMVFWGNMFMTLAAGILASDRMVRDVRLGVRELQSSTPLQLPVYILSKYLGVLAAALVPMLICLLVSGTVYILLMGAPVKLIGVLLLAFLGMAVPAHTFVIAFSLACPLVFPLRVYQVLFTGYWFWGNYLSPKAFPTISDTLLVPSGKYVLEWFLFGYAAAQTAVLNLLVLFVCAAVMLIVLHEFLRWQRRRA